MCLYGPFIDPKDFRFVRHVSDNFHGDRHPIKNAPHFFFFFSPRRWTLFLLLSSNSLFSPFISLRCGYLQWHWKWSVNLSSHQSPQPRSASVSAGITKWWLALLLVWRNKCGGAKLNFNGSCVPTVKGTIHYWMIVMLFVASVDLWYV